MGNCTITPAIYRRLLEAYRQGVTQRGAAVAAGCGQGVSQYAYNFGYTHIYHWAPAIRAVLAGAVPEPDIPNETEWPPPIVVTDPPPPKEQNANVFALSSKRAHRAKLHQFTLSLGGDETVDDGEAVEGIEAIKVLRKSLGHRVKALARAGEDIDAALCHVASAVRQYTESLSAPGVLISARDLTEIAAAIKVLNATAMETGQQLERMIDAEARHDPAKVVGGNSDGFAEAQSRADAVQAMLAFES